jgi:hypothetical protein
VLFAATDAYRLDERPSDDNASAVVLTITSTRDDVEPARGLTTREVLELVEDLERWLTSRGAKRNR